MNEAQAEALWEWGLTKAEKRAQALAYMHARQSREKAEALASWRRRHPEATCRDAVAAILAELELQFGEPY